jgi:superfamily II DNA or RNA helicase/tetratricopeptide (TPR) repeat protein
VLWVLAAADEAYFLPDLLAVLKSSGLPGTKRLSQERLAAVIDSLKQCGAVEMAHPRFRCAPPLLELACRDAVKEDAFKAVANALTRATGRPHIPRFVWERAASFDEPVREVRIAFYLRDARELQRRIERLETQQPGMLSGCRLFSRLILSPFDSSWFWSLPASIRAVSAVYVLDDAITELFDVRELIDCLLARREDVHPAVQHMLVDCLLMQGRLAEAAGVLRHLSGPAADLREGWLAFLAGDNDQALAVFERALEALHRQQGVDDTYFETLGGTFYIFALLRRGQFQDAASALLYSWRGTLTAHLGTVPEALVPVAATRYRAALAAGGPTLLAGGQPQTVRTVDRILREGADAGDIDPHEWFDDEESDTTMVFRLIALHLLGNRGIFLGRQDTVHELLRNAWKNGYGWVAAELAAVWEEIYPSTPLDADLRQEIDAFRTRWQFGTIVGSIPVDSYWERALVRLEHYVNGSASGESQEQRVAWRLRWIGSGEERQISVFPVLQRPSKRGGWTKGRSVYIDSLRSRSSVPGHLLPQDNAAWMVAAIPAHQLGYRYDGRDRYKEQNGAVLEALAGHPRVAWESRPNEPVDIVTSSPTVHIERRGEELVLHLEPEPERDSLFRITQEGPNRLRVVRFTEQHLDLDRILGGGICVPVSAQERILKLFPALSGTVAIQSDVGTGAIAATQLQADSRPHIQISPEGDGLMVDLMVLPLGASGPRLTPGRGGVTLVAEVDGVRHTTERDLEEERAQAEAVLAACPLLGACHDGTWSWHVGEPENCLELLLQLQALDDSAVVEWPKGETLKVTREFDADALSLSINRKRDWFAVSGDVQVDEGLTVSFAELVRLAGESTGRFLPLSDGQFLAVTDAFRRKLDEMGALGAVSGSDLRVSPLLAGAFEQTVGDEVAVETDAEWDAQLDRVAAAQSLVPELPSTFQGDLRDYQLDGFRWLARLAAWGAGACLADDMGLGKTVQALAVILMRAEEGPSLVIAPTSVCMNWDTECTRFTPTLKPIRFGQGDRSETLEALGARDVLVCSYGLLHTESERRSEVRWQTVVLDEAQAIKNPRAKRSQAAFRLEAGFRIITTGTPIENNLTELWSLFRFINPGLLGNLKSFMERFGTPIEKHQDKYARQHLRKLIHPFILRRTKSEVLEELPPRTEVVIHVELGSRERAFYEALRRDAVDKLASLSGEPGTQRFQVLAEITRLRQACCNPKLIAADAKLPSAKLDAFQELLDELILNRHKALVFSQFVSHLAIIRERLDELGVDYQYLDGSTPVKVRRQSVDAFQRGEGDVFLISLKAGGTGLNLTAADYVIHMDPWWNPAVEDQASDRAHRIGQERPVTIYRLVAADTIEDSIVALHQEKRDLADRLLEGSAVPATVSVEELMRLMLDA